MAPRQRSHPIKPRRLVVTVGALIVMLLGASDAFADEPDPLSPKYVGTRCEVEFYEPPDANVECGYVIVPEDRSKPDGNKVRLSIARIRGPTPFLNRDPVIYLQGGPGAGSVEFIQRWLNDAGFLWRERDLILIDQRGMGFSEPHLDCPQYVDRFYELRDEELDPVEELAVEVEMMIRCRDRLVGEGIDVNAYTTRAAANDVVEAAVAMGYERWNLYGASYGLHVALTVMRDHPEYLRSVILDGVVPTQANWYETFYAEQALALREFFDSCESDVICRRNFPDLEDVFYETVDGFHADPISVTYYDDEGNIQTPEPFDGYDMVGLVAGRLRSERWIPYLPFLIYQVRDGNPVVAESWRNPINFSGIRPTENLGARYSILCNDVVPFNDLDKIEADEAAHPRLKDPDELDTSIELCARWGAEPDAFDHEPVVSDIPTLLLSGQFDPVTPPAQANMAAETLANSYSVVVPGAGHVVGIFTDCGSRMVERFLEDPDTLSATSCLHKGDRLAFSTGIYLNRGANAWFSQGFEPKIGPDPFIQIKVIGLLFLSAFVGWPVVFTVSRLRNVPSSKSRWEGPARAMTGATVILGFFFLDRLTTALEELNTVVANFGFEADTRTLFVIPYIVAPLTIGVLYFTYRAWREGWWSRFARVHYTLVALSLVWFTWFLNYWDFIGP